MPANKAASKRSSFASGQNNGFKKRFDLTNKKVQFFVVIGIFAILGGGYFTVRSFADTVVRTWTGNQIYPDKIDSVYTCTNQAGTEPGKNSAPTMDIVCKTPLGGDFLVPGIRQIATQTATYQACVNAKGTGVLRIYLTASGTRTNIQQHKMINDGSYRTYCSYPAYPKAGATLDLSIGVFPDGSGTNPPPALVKVLNVKLQQVGTTTPAPTPAPAK